MQKSSPANVRLPDSGIHSFVKQQWQSQPLTWMTAIAALILFACSSLRHALIQSNGWDLGLFDQAVYLISQGLPPISSFLGFHIVGDHAAFVFYPLALLYKIYPDVHWLLAVQALALASGALPIRYLARLAGLSTQQTVTVAVAYFLYPVVFNSNLFDFHPDVFALPALLWAILAARLGQLLWFCVAVSVVLACKSILALTVAGLGFWLLVFDKRRVCGAIALVAGIAWFLIATGVIIPSLGGAQKVALTRYAYLGDSALDIAKNLVLKPGAILPVVFSWDNLKYLLMLFLPVAWGLSPKHLTPLVGAMPALALNLLANYQPQKSLTYQYSIAILPFLMVAVIGTLAADRAWLKNRRVILLWSLLFFLVLGKWRYFLTMYLPKLDTWQASREAIALVQRREGSVLTTNQFAPHLSHRPFIAAMMNGSEFPKLPDFTEFKYILLNKRYPDMGYRPNFGADVGEQLRQRGVFRVIYKRDDVVLYERVTDFGVRQQPYK
jgi:uncharacterized membrane protein